MVLERKESKMYDLIGDIHGHADELEAWLKAHGYAASGRGYKHPERTLIFLGDLIDRGPKIRRVVEIARAMVDSGAAKIIMGNHEFNALCYHTEDSEKQGEFLRKHNSNHVEQHRETLSAFPNPTEMAEVLSWFYTIPMWLDLPELRAVHACWHEESVALLRATFPDAMLRPDVLAECAKKTGMLYGAIENLLKGPEAKLPPGFSFNDKYNKVRTNIRVKWCVPADGHTYRSYSFPEQEAAPELPVEGVALPGYPEGDKPVFFGHYWLNDSIPAPVTKNCFCLDYSVANQGYLCGYRLGEGFLVAKDELAHSA
jgi:hypothetical protein